MIFLVAMVILSVVSAVLGYQLLSSVCNSRRELVLGTISMLVVVVSTFSYLINLFGTGSASDKQLTVVSIAVLALVGFDFIVRQLPKDDKVKNRVDMRGF